MPGKTKKFIDKKNSVTFYLAHRSQKDPLITDETAPQRVLVPIEQAGGAGAGPSKSSDVGNKKAETKSKKEQLIEYGIYFDDDYDYLQHLKNSEEVSNIEWDIRERIHAPRKLEEENKQFNKANKGASIQLPSSVFASQYEEKIGLLNKAVESKGPRPDLDPDVLAAMDEDFDFSDDENILEDNFIELANGGDSEIEGKIADTKPATSKSKNIFNDDMEFEDDDDQYSDEERDHLGKLMGDQYSNLSSNEENTRFTNYSMSSSVVRRNEQLTLLDDRFEKMFEDYDDTEIGALDCDEIEGHLPPESDLLLKYAEKFEEDKEKEENLNEKIEKLVMKQEEEEENAGEQISDTDEEEKEKWDCESIISTYSTTKNRPKLIREPRSGKIKISGKTNMPVGVLGLGLTKDAVKELDADYEQEHGTTEPTAKSMISTLSAIRNKDETPEERHRRKKLLREYRQERRVERKANTNAFKDEKKRQVKIRLNNVANVQGLKI